MALNNKLIKDFQKITRYNLQNYFLGVEEMSTNHSSIITSFYSGRTNTIPTESLRLLDSLVSESLRLDHIVGLNASRFQTTDYWDLLELIEEAKVKLQTINNTPKWARASVTLAKRVNKPEVSVQLKQGQTIERLLGGELGYDDEHQSWYDVAIKNDVIEEGYTSTGGLSLNVAASGGRSFQILSIVDIMDKETMKGKDIDRRFTWEDDDLRVLDGDGTFLQALNILVNLKKKDNPEFISQGLSKEIAVGQNVNSISYPILIRQLTETMGTDDSIDNFSITRIDRNQDGVFLELSVESKSKAVFDVSTTF